MKGVNEKGIVIIVLSLYVLFILSKIVQFKYDYFAVNYSIDYLYYHY
jgi:hypothetical protein